MKIHTLLLSVIMVLISVKVFPHTHMVTTAVDSIAGSLREAINNAQSGDTVIFDVSLTEIILGEKINISKSVTIKGYPDLVIRGRGAPGIFPRVFEITGDLAINVNFENCNLFKTGFFIGDTVSYNTDGGIILIRNTKANVHINACYFTPQGSYGGYIHYYPQLLNGQNGGAIANYGGMLTISNCTFSFIKSGGSVYTGAGGAIYQLSGALILRNCTFYSNSVWNSFSSSRPFIGRGSAIYAQNSNLDVTNCTFCEHTNYFIYFKPAPDYGSVSVTTSTISVNNSKLIIQNSIFYDNDNRDLSGDVTSTFSSGGYNIFDQTLSVNDGASLTDQYNCNPGFKLNNGSVKLSNDTFWIPVCALDAAGPAIDAIPADGNGASLCDQRGHARVNTPDIGAFEFEGCIPVEVKAKWNPSCFGQNSWASDMSVVDDNVVWVKDASADSISITTNGGATWTTKPLPAIAGFPGAAGGICALSASKAYYILSLSDAKGIYMTTNGGDTWNKQTTGFTESNSFPDIVHFWNENEGVAVGDALPDFEIYTTSNGGAQWNRVPESKMPNGNNEGTWNSQEAFKVVGNSIFFITNTARIFKSVDKGITWSVINTPFHNSADSTITFDFKDNNNGLVSYCSNDDLNHKIYRTTNGGQTWDSISTTNFYQRVKYIPAANAYFSMNNNGGLSYSCDDGLTWTSSSYFNTIKLRTVGFSPSGKIFWGGVGTIYYSSPVLAVSDYNLTMAAPANSTRTFDILSNTDWIASSNQTWLSVSSSSGTGNSTITLTGEANQGAASRTATVTVTGNDLMPQTIIVTQQGIATGISTISEQDFVIYPNPAGTVLYFSSKAENMIISVFDINGKLILNKQVFDGQLNVVDLRGGVYTMKIENPKGIVTKKFVKL